MRMPSLALLKQAKALVSSSPPATVPLDATEPRLEPTPMDMDEGALNVAAIETTPQPTEVLMPAGLFAL